MFKRYRVRFVMPSFFKGERAYEYTAVTQYGEYKAVALATPRHNYQQPTARDFESVEVENLGEVESDERDVLILWEWDCFQRSEVG